jgi:hypothetical protein
MERRGFFAATLGGFAAAVLGRRQFPKVKATAYYHDRLFVGGDATNAIVNQDFLWVSVDDEKPRRFIPRGKAGAFTLWG